MATANIYDGSTMRLYVNTGSGAIAAIGYATTTTVDLSADTVSRSHKDNTGGSWQESTPKTLSGSISFEAFWSQTTIGSSTILYWDLYTIFENRTQIAFAVKTATSGDKQLTGFGYVTALSGTATDKEDATFSGTITISGAVVDSTIT